MQAVFPVQGSMKVLTDNKHKKKAKAATVMTFTWAIASSDDAPTDMPPEPYRLLHLIAQTLTPCCLACVAVVMPAGVHSCQEG